MTTIAASPRGGRGLFAARPLARGSCVAVLAGPTVSTAAFDAAVEAGTCQYAGMRVGRRYTVDAGLWAGRPAADWYLMNHSRRAANVRPRLVGRAIRFETTRPVAADEELLYAYDDWTPVGWVE